MKCCRNIFVVVFLSLCTPCYNGLVVLMFGGVFFLIFSLFLMLNGEQA